MSSQLTTTWSAHDAALDRLLERVTRDLLIFDHDLVALGLDQPQRHERLRALLLSSPKHRLHIVIRDDTALVARFPRLMRLHAACPHNLAITTAAESVAALTDSIVIADASRALVRIHHDHARSRFIEDDAEAVMPYRKRFDAIVAEGGHPFSARPAGL